MSNKARNIAVDEDSDQNCNLDIGLKAEHENDRNVSNAGKVGRRAALERQWQEVNAQAIEAYNAHVDDCGLPLGQYRQV